MAINNSLQNNNRRALAISSRRTNLLLMFLYIVSGIVLAYLYYMYVAKSSNQKIANDNPSGARNLNKKDLLSELGKALDMNAVATESAQQQYASEKRSFKKSRKAIINGILSIADKNDEALCRSWSVFAQSKVPTVIMSDKEFNNAMGNTFDGAYDHEGKTIRYPLRFFKGLEEEKGASTFWHEGQHAFVAAQNRQKGIAHTFYIPCEKTVQTGDVDCSPIQAIYEKGIARIKQLRALQQKSENQMTFEEKQLLLEYQNLLIQYPGFQTEVILSKEQIAFFQRQGLLNDNLTLNHFCLPYKTDHICRFEHRDGQIYGVIKDTLSDLDNRLGDYTPHPGASHGLKQMILAEIEASIAGCLDPYPKMLDFLFDGWRDYHYQVGSEDYRQCVDASKAGFQP